MPRTAKPNNHQHQNQLQNHPNQNQRQNQPQPKPKRKANPKPKVIKQQSYEADTEAPPIPKQKSFYEVQTPKSYEQESKQLNDRRERDLARLEQLRNLMSNVF